MWATLCGAVVLAGVTAYLAGITRRSYWLTPPTPLPSGQTWGLRWPFMVTTVTNQFNLLSDALLTGFVIGVNAVSSLTITQRLFALAGVFSSSLSGSGSWVGLVDLRARVGGAVYHARLAEVSKLNLGLNLIVLAPVVGLNRRFIALWLGDETAYAGDGVCIATFAFNGVFNWMCLYTGLLDSLGQTRKRVWSAVACSVLMLALIPLLTGPFGLAGIPLAGALAYALTDGWYSPLVVCRMDAIPFVPILAGLLRAVTLGGGWAVACYLIANRSDWVLSGWVGLVSEGLVLEFLGLCLVWVLLFSRVDRALWANRVRGWLPSTRGA